MDSLVFDVDHPSHKRDRHQLEYGCSTRHPYEFFMVPNMCPGITSAGLGHMGQFSVIAYANPSGDTAQSLLVQGGHATL